MSAIAAALRRMLGDDSRPNELQRGGVRVAELDLTDANLVNGGVSLKEAPVGYAIRFLRHGSNPGARLELNFGGKRASKFFAPGQIIRGGFDSIPDVKLALGGARVGKATFAVYDNEAVDLDEDLLISAIGPVDLLGKTDQNGDPVTFVPVPKDTDPSGAGIAVTGAFDGSGWELLRVMVDGNSNAGNFTSSDVVFWTDPSYNGTTWFENGTDGRYSIPDSDISAQRYRSFTAGWAGRGLGCPSPRNLLAAARTGLGFIIQGLR